MRHHAALCGVHGLTDGGIPYIYMCYTCTVNDHDEPPLTKSWIRSCIGRLLGTPPDQAKGGRLLGIGNQSPPPPPLHPILTMVYQATTICRGTHFQAATDDKIVEQMYMMYARNLENRVCCMTYMCGYENY